jgi:hypothetical protein
MSATGNETKLGYYHFHICFHQLISACSHSHPWNTILPEVFYYSFYSSNPTALWLTWHISGTITHTRLIRVHLDYFLPDDLDLKSHSCLRPRCEGKGSVSLGALLSLKASTKNAKVYKYSYSQIRQNHAHTCAGVWSRGMIFALHDLYDL